MDSWVIRRPNIPVYSPRYHRHLKCYVCHRPELVIDIRKAGVYIKRCNWCETPHIILSRGMYGRLKYYQAYYDRRTRKWKPLKIDERGRKM